MPRFSPEELGRLKFADAPAAGGSGRFSPEQLGGLRFADEPAAAPARDVSWIESAARGALQGATFGFADEIVGGAEALFTGKRYAQARDESRANFKAAQAANPGAYLGGDIAGSVATSFIPGLGIAKGASLGAMAGKAALQGAIGGLGASEASDVGGMLSDAAVSGALSGATAGVVGKVTRGAPERVAKRIIGDITDGVPAGMRDKVVGKAGARAEDVITAVKENPALRTAGRDPQRLLPAVEDALATAGAKLDEVYARAGSATPGISVTKVQRALDKVAREYEKDPGKLPMAKAIRAQMDDVWTAWGDRTHVSASDVRTLAGDIGEAAFRGSPAMAPKQGQVAAQQAWGALKGLIDENVDEAAKAIGGAGAKELRDLNRRVSTLVTMRDAVRYRATREATESTRLKDRISGGLDLGLALVDPTTFAAKKAYDIVGKPALRKADEGLAALVTAAKNGSTKAEIAQRAVELGMAPTVDAALHSWFVQKIANQFSAQPSAEE